MAGSSGQEHCTRLLLGAATGTNAHSRCSQALLMAAAPGRCSSRCSCHCSANCSRQLLTANMLKATAPSKCFLQMLPANTTRRCSQPLILATPRAIAPSSAPCHCSWQLLLVNDSGQRSGHCSQPVFPASDPASAPVSNGREQHQKQRLEATAQALAQSSGQKQWPEQWPEQRPEQRPGAVAENAAGDNGRKQRPEAVARAAAGSSGLEQ